MTFAEWWGALPREMRVGSKDRAKRRYEAIAKRGEGNMLALALEAYKRDQGRQSWRSWQHCATFLGDWERWIPEERSEVLEDPELPHETELSVHHHYCKHCGYGHEWTHDDKDCYWPGHFACPRVLKLLEKAQVEK